MDSVQMQGVIPQAEGEHNDYFGKGEPRQSIEHQKDINSFSGLSRSNENDQVDNDVDDDEYWDALENEERDIKREKQMAEANQALVGNFELTEEQALAKYRSNGILSTYQSLEEIGKIRKIRRSKNYIEGMKVSLVQQKKLTDDLAAKLLNDADELRREDKKMKGIRIQLQEANLIRDVTKRRQRQSHLQQQLAVIEHKVDVRKELVETEENLLKTADRNYSDIQVKYSKLRQLHKDISNKETSLARERKVISRHLMIQEAELDRSVERSKAKKRTEVDKEQLLKRQQQAIISENASRYRDAAKKFRLAGRKVIDEARELVHPLVREEEMKRVQSIIELKKSTEASVARIQSLRARRELKAQQTAQKEAEEAKEILRVGGNPEAVFRARKQRHHIMRVQEERKADIMRRELEIVARVRREHQREVEMEAEKFKKAMVEKDYLLSLGRQFQEGKNDAYLRKMTGGRSIIDPTGRAFRIYPSKETLIKDMKFGLGGAPDPILDMVHAKHPNVRPDESLLNPPRTPKPLYGHVNRKHTAVAEPGANAEDTNAVDDESVQVQAEAECKYPQITKAQQEKLDRLMKTHEEWIAKGTEKLVCGKRYTGPKFLSQPAKLVFRDFDMGTTVKQKVALTNVSFCFNSFRMTDIPTEIADAFDVAYERPGRMSAGVTAMLEVSFTPQRNCDIDSELNLLAETGPFSIPIEVRTKKVVIELTPVCSMDFGTVVQADQKTLQLRISNKGALGTTFKALPGVSKPEGLTTPRLFDEEDAAEVEDVVEAEPVEEEEVVNLVETADDSAETIAVEEEPKSLEEIHELLDGDVDVEYDDSGIPLSSFVQRDPVKIVEEVSFARSGSVAAFSSTTLPVTFSPKGPGKFEFVLRLEFGDGDNVSEEERLSSWGSPSVFEITVRGNACKIAIYLERPLLDFQCCIYEKLYRETISIKNRSSATLKVILHAPKKLQKYVRFSPDMGFVQSMSAMKVSVTFAPSMKMNKVKEFYDSAHQNIITFPVEIEVPEQVDPVILTVRAELCFSELEFSCPSFDFGSCYLHESKWLPLTITNKSPLLQRVGFSSIHKELWVQPSDGFVHILPNASITVRVYFAPSACIDHEIVLKCKTKLSREYSFKCKGVGLRSPLKLSCNAIKFAACANGNARSITVFVQNTSNRDRMFEVVPPKDSFVLISPFISSLSPGETGRVVVEFHPNVPDAGVTRSLEEERRKLKELAPTIEDAEEPVKDTQDETGADEAVDSAEASDSKRDVISYSPVGEPWSRHGKHYVPMFVKAIGLEDEGYTVMNLTIETVAILPYIEAEMPEGPVLDFGIVSVGGVQVQQFNVKNISDHVIDLECRHLPSSCPFSVLNALRPIQPGDKQIVAVEFRPVNQLNYKEFLSVSQQIMVPLVGQGCLPDLEIEPDSNNIDMGNIMVGDSAVRFITIRNKSVFPLPFELQTMGTHERNRMGRVAWMFTPFRGHVPAKEEVKIKCTLQPDHESDDYFALVKCDVPNMDGDRFFEFSGNCWNRQVYLLWDDDVVASSTYQSYKIYGNGPPRLSAQGDQDNQAAAAAEIPEEIMHIMMKPKEVDGAITTTFSVGSCEIVSQELKGVPGSFDFATSEDAKKHACLCVEPASGNLTSGAKSTVKITFDAAKWKDVEGTGLIRSKQEEIVVTLKGGLNLKGPDARTIRIKCTIQMDFEDESGSNAKPISLEMPSVDSRLERTK